MVDYSTLIGNHVTLKCRSIDRIFLQAYLSCRRAQNLSGSLNPNSGREGGLTPRPAVAGLVIRFLRWVRGVRVPTSAAFVISPKPGEKGLSRECNPFYAT
jgi:hypothetical protein